MNPITTLRRKARPVGRTVLSALRWRRLSFLEAPSIFGNAKPKSGSHLLLQVLEGFTRVLPLAYVEAEPIRSITKDGRRRSTVEILEDLKRIPAGVIGWGYLEPSPENIQYLCKPNRVNYFIYRDPRDLLVSQVYFATDMHEGHGMHAYYRSLPDFAARLKVAITGIDQDGLKMVNVRQRYEAVLRWLEIKDVLCLRYEDFLDQRPRTLNAMLDAVQRTDFVIPTPRPEALRILEESIRPRKSRTFRSGKAGGWREHFEKEHKRLFLDVAGDLLLRLGYEQDDGW